MGSSFASMKEIVNGISFRQRSVRYTLYVCSLVMLGLMIVDCFMLVFNLDFLIGQSFMAVTALLFALVAIFYLICLWLLISII